MKFRKIAFTLFLSILSFIGYSQINVNTNFYINAPLPIDTRMKVADITARDAIVWRYEGLSVYVVSDQTNYQLRGGTTNANWVTVYTSAYTSGTGITLSGSTFSHTPHTGDATGATSLTVVAIQGRTLASTIPSNGDILGWNGSAWAPATAFSNYATGSGLLLSNNTFSALNSQALWNANQINGSSISTIAPANNQLLKWSGSEWVPANEVAYASGTGITLAANTFSHTAHTGDATGATSLTVVAIQGVSVSTTVPLNSQLLKYNGTNWIPTNEVAYASGTGITLAANTFSHTAHTGDAIGATSLTVVALQGVGISSTVPTTSQVLRYNGTNWIPSNEVVYAAGSGLSLVGNTFTNTGDDLSSVNELQNLSYTIGTRTIGISTGSGVVLPLFATATTDAGLVAGSNGAGGNVFLNGNGTWSAPPGTNYDAGTGITLTSNSFSHTAHTGDATGATSLTVVALQGRSVTTTIPTAGNFLGWNGANWIPSTPIGSVYSAGTGLSLTGTVFTNTGDLSSVNELQNLSYAIGTRTIGISTGSGAVLPLFATATTDAGLVAGSNGAGGNVFLNGNGTWTAPPGTNYEAGTGITLTSNSFSHTAHTGDAIGATSLTVVAIQGRSVTSTIPTSGNFLGWNGTNWIPSTPIGSLYSAGTGLSLTGSVFDNTGDLSSVNELQSLSYTAGTRTLGISTGTGVVLPLYTPTEAGLVPAATTGSALIFLNGAGAWTAPVGTTYSSGTGITLTGTVFSHTAHTGDATGTTSLTVVALQGRSILTTAPSSNEILKWNGTDWAPAADNNTTYSAGTGLSLTGTVFANTGDLSSVNELQNLSYTIGTRTIGISTGSGAVLPMFATATTDAGLVAGSNGAGANVFLNGNGTWSAPPGTNYEAGTGITLTSNSFSHTAHTGDATGSTSLTVVAIQGRSVVTAAPAASDILKWNGAAWAPAADNNTTYSAGTGLSLTGTVFDNTGDLSASNELQNLSYTPATRALGITTGSGVTLPLFTSTADGLTPLSGGGTTTFLRADGAWSAPVGTSYTNGIGITLTSNTFSHTAHTGDATGTTSLTVVALQGRSVASATPTSGDVLSWDGTTWNPSAPATYLYAAGSGITLSSNTFSHIAHTGDATGITSLTVVAIQGRNITTTIPTNGDVLTWDNTSSIWKPAQTTNSGVYSGNRAVKRPNWTGVSGVNMGTTTNVADFLDAVFFPFISAQIEFDAPFQLLFEIGTTNSVSISGYTTPNDETVFSLGRIDKIYTGAPTQIYAFGAATTFSTSVTFSPTQVVSTQDAWYRSYQTVANGVGPASEIQSNVKYVQSCYPYLHGVSSINLTSGGTAAYTVLNHLIEQQGPKSIYPAGTNGYLYYCYPASYGPLTSILDPNNFESISSFTQFTANVTSVGLVNDWTESYYIYQYNNLSTYTGLIFQFKY